MTLHRPHVQLDLFDGPTAVPAPRKGKKKTPATATNSPGAVIDAKSRGNTDAQKCSRLLVRKQTVAR